MDSHPSAPAGGPTSSSRHHTNQNYFPPPTNIGWNNHGQGYPGNVMTPSDCNPSQWSNSHFPPQPPLNNFSQPPPPSQINFSQSSPIAQNHFSQPPPPPPHLFNAHRPPLPTGIHSVRNQPPPLENNKLPHPNNFYHSTSPLNANINRPPPPLPNPPHPFYPHPTQQGFPPKDHNIRFNVGPQQMPLNRSHPPSLPSQNYNSNIHHSQIPQYQSNEQQKSQLNNFTHGKVDISNSMNDCEKNESEMEKKRKIGQQRLNSWLHKIGKVKKKVTNAESRHNTPSLKINEYLCQLQSYMAMISDMSSQVERLDSIVLDADKASWQQECNTMETLKTKHWNLQSVVDKTNVEKVEKKLYRTKQTKARLKRSRHLQFQEAKEMEERRQAKERQISDWQQRLLSEMKEDLMKKKRKQEMDQTLSEVTKKIHDANRLIDTMTALEKLRLIRQDAAKKRGDSDLGESRQSFEQKICDMTRLVHSQLEVYKEEEDKLRGAIKSEQEETSKKERQIQESKDKEEQRQKDEDLRQMIFGFSEDANVSDPLFPYQQYYKQAERSLPAFVHIRHEWDQYAVPASDPGGSSIPSSWVLPSDPSSSDWASALV